MAQRTVVTTHSDFSGEPGAVTVRFAFEDTRWEIDLTPAEREAFVRVIAPYTEKARRAPRR
ncbi:MAG: Lsr2 family protein [Micrococcales bacterium]|nr:Lsr2 family protein [Micrococcales bacterium]MCL2668613.1 Lsr2 family protein [Micrococcales bacterium]